MSSPYAPPLNPVTDNMWHAVLLSFTVAFLVWNLSLQTVEVFREAEVSASLAGPGGALLDALDGISAEDPDGLWSHLVGLLGWGLALGAVFRSLNQQGGFSASIPSLLVLLCFPGLFVWMLGAGTMGFACWCFVRGIRSLQNASGPSGGISGAGWMGISALLHPVFLLPALFTVVGVYEAKRRLWVPFAATLGGSLLIGLAAWITTGALWEEMAVPLHPDLLRQQWLRHLGLWGGLGLMLGYGATRRGVGWWSLIGSLGLPVWALLHGSTRSSQWIPLVILVSLGIAKVPVLLDLRHPRAYLSVLVFQLFLWIPASLPPEETSSSIEPEPVNMPADEL